MNTVELKSMINERLSNIEDISFLQSIHNLIESRLDDKIYKLSDEQILRVEETQIDFITGQTLTNDAVIMEIESWLNSK